MAKIKRYTEKDGDYQGQLGFKCPGCGSRHFVYDSETTGHPNSSVWTFNGDFEKPTIRASVLVSTFTKNYETGIYDIPHTLCHSFITDGMIQFLSDCSHALAGQTVELPDM